MQDPELLPDYFEILTETTEINTNEKLKLWEQQYVTARSIVLSDAQDEYENKKAFWVPQRNSCIYRNKTKEKLYVYPNVVGKQRDTVLKSPNTKQIYNSTFDFPKPKTKLTSKHFKIRYHKSDNPY